MTNERSQTPLMQISLHVHREVAGEERRNQADPRVESLLQQGYRLDFKVLPKLSKIPLILSEYHNKNKDMAPYTR